MVIIYEKYYKNVLYEIKIIISKLNKIKKLITFNRFQSSIDFN